MRHTVALAEHPRAAPPLAVSSFSFEPPLPPHILVTPPSLPHKIVSEDFFFFGCALVVELFFFGNQTLCRLWGSVPKSGFRVQGLGCGVLGFGFSTF